MKRCAERTGRLDVNEGKTPIAFQGEHGAFSEEAVFRYFSGRGKRKIRTLPCETFRDVVESVEKGKAEYGILPVENSQEGNVDEACDQLLNFDLHAVGEIKLQIVHCLIGHRGAGIEDVKRVYSHPQGLRQCRDFLERQDWEKIPAYDTAGSVKFISKRGDKSEAAIASKKAAEIYDAKILQEGIESNRYNYTRFLVISRTPKLPCPSILCSSIRNADTPMKTSIVFSTRHAPGTLYDCLGELARRKINMTKIESRPRKNRPWEYVFFIDFEGSVEDKRCREAINAMLEKSSFLKIIGSYHAAIEAKSRG